MSRYDRLNRFIESRKNTDFEWGVNDCALFAADAVKVQTGADFGSEWRGNYETALECSRLLNERKTSLEQIATDAFGEPVSVKLLKRGDVCLFDNGDGLSLGVCVGVKIASTGKTGVEYVDMKNCVKGWNVCK